MGLYWGYIGIVLGLCRGYIGKMEKKMETTIMGSYRVSAWGYIGITEKQMETTIMGSYFRKSPHPVIVVY